ncbi:hypothetical protein H8356DRAFT_1403341 [Neocallimastix lanati (nom. inval.)]|nr:hypothetical protein H8356DRAFT_1403341 [Neocallimastix sp. JGI-2020a]
MVVLIHTTTRWIGFNVFVEKWHRLPMSNLLFTWNLSPLQSSKFSFEYLLHPSSAIGVNSITLLKNFQSKLNEVFYSFVLLILDEIKKKRNTKSERLVTYATNELEGNDNNENNRNEEEFFYKESILLEKFLDFDLFLNNIRSIKNNEDLLKTIPLGYLKTYNNNPCQKSSEYKYD